MGGAVCLRQCCADPGTLSGKVLQFLADTHAKPSSLASKSGQVGNMKADAKVTNAGFMAVDLLAQKHGASNFRVAHESFMADIVLGGEKILLLKPQTYMNLSGRAVASAMQFYKLAVGELLVIVDDVALPAGVIRLRATGSAWWGAMDSRTFRRRWGDGLCGGCVDWGVMRPSVIGPNVPQKSYVLGMFTAEQKPKLDAAAQSWPQTP